MARRKAVTKTSDKNLPAKIDLISDAGSGFEDADKDAFAIPFLTILQKMHPQVDKDDALFVKGAKPGLIFNTVTETLYKPPLTVVPVKYMRQFIEWIPRNAGGGFVQFHEVSNLPEYEVNENFGWELENGNELKDHRNHFVILAETLEPSLISMTSSQLKISKKWMSQMQALKVMVKRQKITPPMFYSRFKMSVVLNENEKGKWNGWRIERIGESTDGEYFAAKEFKAQIEAGTAKADFEKMEETEEEY